MHVWRNKSRYPFLTPDPHTSLALLYLNWRPKQNFILPSTPFLSLFLLLLGNLLLASRRLGFGQLDLGAGDLWSRQCLRRLLGLLGVGTECSSAAWDVDVLSVIRNMLQCELRAVACAQAHGARTQCVSRLTHFCRGKRRKKGINTQHEGADRWVFE